MLTGFLVSAAVTTPILGRLGDQYGKGRMLLVSLGLFLAGCIGAAAAWNIGSLIGFRILSGAGGALFPLSFAIIRDEFPPERVKVAIGLLSAVFGVGGGLGIVLSGRHRRPRLLALALHPRLDPRRGVARCSSVASCPSRPCARPRGSTCPGALLLAGGLISLMLALTEGEDWGWGSPAILGARGGSVALFLSGVVVELRSSSPMVDMRMLAHRPVLLTNTATMVSGFALFSCFVLVPTFVQAPVLERLRVRGERDGGRVSSSCRRRSRCSSPVPPPG